MNDVGQQTLADGISALMPLYEGLPEPIRSRARAIAGTFDPRSVAATTSFIASGEQPFAGVADLERIACPTLVVAQHDDLHPAAVADRYIAAIPNVRGLEVTADNPAPALAALGDLCSQLA